MSRIHNSITDLIGNTPLLELHNYRRKRNLGARIIAKIEYFNPAGSLKPASYAHWLATYRAA